MFVPKRGGTIAIYIHAYWMNSGNITGYPWAAFMYCYMNSCLIGTLSIYTKAVTLATLGGSKDSGDPS